MALDPVAQARIDLELNDDALVAGLRRVREEHERTMRDIDRSEAEAKIDLETAEFEDKIKNVKREMARLRAQKADPKVALDEKDFKRDMKRLRKELVQLTGQKAEIELKVKGEQTVLRTNERIRKATERRIEAERRAEAARQKQYEAAERRRIAGVRNEARVSESLRRQREREMNAAHAEALRMNNQMDREAARAEKARLAALRQQARVSASLNRQREREMAQAHQWALRLNREMDQARAARERELASVPRLQREYAELTLKLERLERARRRAFPDERAQVMVDLQVTETEAKMRALVAELERIGSDVDVRIDFKRGERLGRDIREGLRRGGLTEAGYQAGRGIGLGLLRGVRNMFSPRRVANHVGNTVSKLGQMLSALSTATVRVGPFTTTIRTLMIALTVLGPTLVDVVGALTSLIGVVGTGLVGALGLGAGALASFGLTLGGVAFLIPTLLRDFKNLTSLSDAYHKAVLKYGKNSEKAKDKLKEFNKALGQVQPSTREAFLGINEMKDRWNELAQDVRPDFLDALGEGLKTVNDRMEWFADSTKRSFRIIGREWTEWMRGLRSDEATVILKTLASNGRRSLAPLMEALGSLFTWFGRIASTASNHLPGLMRQFRDWAQGVADGVGPTTDLGERFERLVDHTRALGRFLMATTRFLGSFFNASADAGENFLDVMTRTLNGWTRFNRSAEGRNKINEFMERAVAGTRALYRLLEPMVSTFVTWASQMSPIVTGIMDGVGGVTALVLGFAKLVGMQDSLSTLATTLGAIWAVGRIKNAVGALSAFSSALFGLGGASAAAAAGAGAGGAGGRGGILASLLGGAAGRRIIGPAEKKWSNVIKTTAFGAVRGAGLIGAGILAMELIGKGFGTAKAREGFTSTVLGLSRDVLSTFSFGIADSAEESSAKAAKAAVDALRRNINLELDKNIKLGGGGLNAFSTKDLTAEQKEMLEGFQKTLQDAARIARNFQMPDITAAVRVTANPQDFQTIERNMNKLKNRLVTTVGGLRSNVEETLQAMGRSMDLNTQEGQRAVERNMGLTAQTIKRLLGNGKMSANQALREIRNAFRVHSQASKRSADVNFGAAKTAIEQAVKDGEISSKKGLRAIRKLWVEYLSLYGFNEKQARNIAKTGDPDANRGREGGAQRAMRASGGLVSVGRPGQTGRDTVPMDLNGVPSIVAPGEQIAVFNRHQQRAANRYLPGGLEGFFASNRRPHYMAGGGIVPVPGFPGERAHSSILDEIAWVARTFGLVLTDAYGQGHKSPGHTQTGTAADFSGPDRAMDAAVRALVAKGYIVGYDGRFGSQDWPDHGPSTRTPNFHLHVEFGGKGSDLLSGFGLEAQQIERQMAMQGLGAMTHASQQVLDTARAAAQANLDKVAAQSLAVPMAGGHGVGPGAGAATRSQMERWASMALKATRGLGHGGATAGNIAKLLTLAMKESSWIVDSINNWDINAQRGNPSGGLMHVTIDKVGGSREALFDPVTNMIASIRYQMKRYGKLITFSPYAMGGLIDTMPQAAWERGGMVERPTLMTGEDGKRAPEFVIGTNPAYRQNNLQALTAAANKLGVPMARKSKTGTIKPKLVGGKGKDPEKLQEVKQYGKIQAKETDKRRQISIAESRVKEPDTLIKQQGTDAHGNPIYVVDEAKINAYVSMLNAVKKLYDDLIDRIMVQLAQQAQRAFWALDTYRENRTRNIHALDSQNRINKRLMRSKDEHTRTAAERRYNAGIEMRNEQIALRSDAAGVKQNIREDQHDAQYRVQEYGIARQGVIDDINAVGTRAAEQAASETEAAYKEPDIPETPDTSPGSGNSPAEIKAEALQTELALAQAGYGLDGRLGTQRPVEDIINDLIAANESRITEAQALLRDADPTNDQTAYQAITDAANEIKSLREDLEANKPPSYEMEFHTLGTAMLDLYRSFGTNMMATAAPTATGAQASSFIAGDNAVPVGGGATQATGGKSAPIINIEQNFPTQPDPMTWAASTSYELNAAL